MYKNVFNYIGLVEGKILTGNRLVFTMKIMGGSGFNFPNKTNPMSLQYCFPGGSAKLFSALSTLDG